MEALAKPGPDDWLKFPLLMLATVLVRGFGDFTGEFLLSRVSYRVVHQLRIQLFDQLLRMPSAYFDRSAKGHLVSRITFNVAQLRDTATDALKSVVQDGSKVIVLLGAMIWANWRLTMIFLVIAPVVAIVVSYASNRFRSISRRIQNSMGDVTHVASEAVNGYRVVRTFGGEAYERKRFEKSSRANQQQNLKMVVTKAWSTEIIQVFVAGALSVLIALLFQPRIAGSMSPGDVVYFVGSGRVAGAPHQEAVGGELAPAAGPGRGGRHLLATGSGDGTGQRHVHVLRGQPGVSNFATSRSRYESGSGPVLHDIDLVVEPGQRVALVGRSGAGKSTLVSLIPRFYDASSGEILLDGRPLADYDLRSLRDQIALVTQQVVLFNDTLERNIAYGRLSRFVRGSDLERGRTRAR